MKIFNFEPEEKLLVKLDNIDYIENKVMTYIITSNRMHGVSTSIKILLSSYNSAELPGNRDRGFFSLLYFKKSGAPTHHTRSKKNASSDNMSGVLSEGSPLEC